MLPIEIEGVEADGPVDPCSCAARNTTTLSKLTDLP